MRYVPRRWDLVESPASYYLAAEEIPPTFVTERTMVYTPSVANMPRQIERTVQGLRKRVNALAVRAPQAIRAPQASTARLQRWYAAYHDWLLVMPFG